MNLICRGRQMGKTTELVAQCKANNGILVVFNQPRKQQVMNEFGLKKEQIITFHEATSVNYQRSCRDSKPLYIDDVEQILYMIFSNSHHRPIETVTMTANLLPLKDNTK